MSSAPIDLITDEERVQEGIKRIAGAVGLPYVPPGATAIVFGDDEDLVGGWLFERYTGPGGSIVLHWAAENPKRWLRRSMMTLVALYVFDQLQCRQAIGEVRRSETYVLEVNEKVGFKQIAVIPGYFPGDDLVIMALAREDARWLPKEV